MNRKSIRRIAIPTILMVLLAACGGGSSSPSSNTPITTSIKGVAAAGNPIIGSVTLRDSSVPYKEKSTTILADGTYKIDTTGLTAPFVLRAVGNTIGGNNYILHSGAVSSDIDGNINITPLTDLIIANIAGKIAGNYFDAGSFAGLTAKEVSEKEATLRARLQPILTAVGVTGSLDLLRTAFSADHTKIDAALDVLRVTVDPVTNTATIINTIDNLRITDNLAAADTSVLNALNVSNASLTDLQAIKSRFNALTSLFATSLPAPSNATLLGLFDAAKFLDSGDTFSGFLSDITSDPSLVGLSFKDVLIRSASPAVSPTSAKVQFTLGNSGVPIGIATWNMVKVNGVWLIQGDGRQVPINIHPHALYVQGGTTGNGLRFSIGQGGIDVSYVVVKGKGLPSSGLLMVNPKSGADFYIAGATYSGVTTTALKTTFGEFYNSYALTDAVIETLSDTEAYTFELYKDNGTPTNLADDILLSNYVENIPTRPSLSSELKPASFAVISTAASEINAFALAGGTLISKWTLPSNLYSNYFNFHRFGVNGNQNIESNLKPTATSNTTSAGAPNFAVNTSVITVDAFDVFGREYSTRLYGK